MGLAVEGNHSVLKHFRASECIVLAVVMAIAIFSAGLDWCDYEPYERYKGWLLAILGIAVVYSTIPALIRCGMSGGVKSVWSVVRASLAILAFSLLVFYGSYYWIADAAPLNAKPSDKFLNFPPVIAALWTAGMGWYIHFQATSKNHRTTNSFNLVMQTRTSKEFLERTRAVQAVYPFGAKVPKEDSTHFGTAAMRELQEARDAAAASAPAGTPPADFTAIERKVIAIDGLKYLLNYYEFMAVGIAANDLEEEMLYETISENVCSLYERAENYIEHTHANGQPLAFEALELLVKRWRKMLEDEKHQKLHGGS